MQVTLQYAQEHLSELLNAAVHSGQPVEITQSGKPAFRVNVTEGTVGSTRPMAIGPWPGDPVAPLIRDGRLVLGAGRGEMRVPSEEEWHSMDLELEAIMNDASIFPPEDPCAF